ncbi:MAG: hypothetical protein R3Y52_00735 [Psittacicella sp.]
MRNLIVIAILSSIGVIGTSFASDNSSTAISSTATNSSVITTPKPSSQTSATSSTSLTTSKALTTSINTTSSTTLNANSKLAIASEENKVTTSTINTKAVLSSQKPTTVITTTPKTVPLATTVTKPNIKTSTVVTTYKKETPNTTGVTSIYYSFSNNKISTLSNSGSSISNPPARGANSINVNISKDTYLAKDTITATIIASTKAINPAVVNSTTQKLNSEIKNINIGFDDITLSPAYITINYLTNQKQAITGLNGIHSTKLVNMWEENAYFTITSSNKIDIMSFLAQLPNGANIKSITYSVNSLNKANAKDSMTKELINALKKRAEILTKDFGANKYTLTNLNIYFHSSSQKNQPYYEKLNGNISGNIQLEFNSNNKYKS